MSPGYWTLRRKVFVMLVATTLTPLVVTGVLVIPGGGDLLERDARARLHVVSDAAADRIDAVNERYFDLLAGLERLPATHAACSVINAGEGVTAEKREIFAAFAASDTAILAVSLADRMGHVAFSTAPAHQGHDVTRRGFYLAARARPGPAIELGVPSGISDGGPVLAYAQTTGSAQPCVMIVAVDSDRLYERVREMHGALGEGSFMTVLDERGVIIAHSLRGDFLFRPTGPLPRDELESMVASQRFGPDTRTLLESVVDAPVQFERARAPVLDDPMRIKEHDSPANDMINMSVARRLTTARWTVVMLVPTSTIYAQSRDLLRTTGLVGMAALGIVLLVAMVVSRRVSTPLRELADAAEAVAAGKSGTRVVVRGRDEVAAVAQRFNEMATAIESSTKHLERRVTERTYRLSLSIEQLRAASEELRAQRSELLAQKAELQAQRDQLAQRNEEVARADRAKSEFLANMSHELRTPLNAVIGFADLLLVTAEDRLETSERSQLREIMSAGKHLLLIINDILDLAKIDSGTVRVSIEALDPAAVAADTCAMALSLARSKQIELRTTVRARRAVLADIARLRQVLLNLLSNAIKFSTPGSAIDLAVTDEGEQIRFAITDRGPGIAADLVARVFEPFVQGEGALHKSHQGTGLGLAISKKLVELQGGEIILESKVGIGTTAIVKLPAAGRRVRPSAAPTYAPVVLMIEAEGHGSETRRRLEAAGYRVRVAVPGEDLGAAAESTDFALVVIDAPGSAAGDEALFEQATRMSATVPVLLCSETPQVLAVKPIEPVALRSLCRRLGGTRARPVRVLVVDDDPSVATVVAAALGDGYTVVAAETKAEGYDRAVAERFDLIIVDIGLPDGSGLDLLAALDEQEGTHAVPRIVLIAAQLDAGQLTRLRRHAAAVAHKGAVTPSELLSVVDRLTRPVPAVASSPSMPSVLVVDDSDMNRDLLRSILERLGYVVLQARDGVEAIAIAERERPRLVLLDLAMPGMDGFETARQLRARRELRDIPLVAVTALARRSDEEAARAAGVSEFLTKPIDRLVLERVVAHYVPR